MCRVVYAGCLFLMKVSILCNVSCCVCGVPFPYEGVHTLSFVMLCMWGVFPYEGVNPLSFVVLCMQGVFSL